MSGRGRLPNFLLQHRVDVEPYLSWNTWGPLQPRVRCLVQEQSTRRSTRAGVIYTVAYTIFAPLATTCPDGSKITLPNGKRGYAAAGVVKGGTNLPLPEHLEIAVDVSAVTSPAAGETVILLRRTKIGQDRYHNDTYSTTSVTLGGCAVSRLESVEDNAHGTRVVVAGEVILPPGTVVTALDRIRVRGLTYDIEGPGKVLDDPMASTAGAVQVHIRRTTG